MVHDAVDVGLAAAHDTGDEQERLFAELRDKRTALAEMDRQLGDPLLECREIVEILLAFPPILSDVVMFKEVKRLDGLLYSVRPDGDRETLDKSRVSLAKDTDALAKKHDAPIETARVAITETRAARDRALVTEGNHAVAERSHGPTLQG